MTSQKDIALRGAVPWAVREWGVSGKKKAHKHKLFVRLVLGGPRVCPGGFHQFVPGTDPVKTFDKPGFSPYFTRARV